MTSLLISRIKTNHRDLGNSHPVPANSVYLPTETLALKSLNPPPFKAFILPLCEIIPNSILAILSPSLKIKMLSLLTHFPSGYHPNSLFHFIPKSHPQNSCLHSLPHELTSITCLLFRMKSIPRPKVHSYWFFWLSQPNLLALRPLRYHS